MYDGQMELGLGNERNGGQNGCASRHAGRRQRRGSRAGWWFERMRQIVDRATDWQPAPLPRPEQAWFTNSYRQPDVAAQAAPEQNSGEREICE